MSPPGEPACKYSIIYMTILITIRVILMIRTLFNEEA